MLHLNEPELAMNPIDTDNETPKEAHRQSKDRKKKSRRI